LKFASILDLKRKCNAIVDLSKYTYNKKFIEWCNLIKITISII